MPRLYDLITTNRDWLVWRGLIYARKRCGGEDKTTQEEAWRDFVAGLSESFLDILDRDASLPISLGGPSDDFTEDPIASRGMLLAEEYRASGIPLSVLIGLMNAWREGCANLIRKEPTLSSGDKEQGLRLTSQFLDRLERGLCEAWIGPASGEDSESIRLFRGALDAAPSTFALVDRDSTYLLCDEQFASLVGRPMEEIIGRSVFDLWPQEVAQEICDANLKVLDEVHPLITERRITTSEGVRWYEVTRVPMRNEEGDVIGVVAAGHDITALREMQERLSTDRDRLDVTLRTIGDGVLITDTEGKITLVNPVTEALAGLPQEGALGRSLEEVFQIVNEDTGEPVENLVEKVLRTGEVVLLSTPTTLVGRDGAERAIAVSGAPIRDANGKTIGAVVVFRDVTDRRRLERERDEQLRVLRSALDASPDAIFFKDRDSVYRLCNEAFANFHRMEMKDIIDKTAVDIWPEAMAQKFREEDLRVLGGEQVVSENCLEKPWGNFWYESIKTPVRGENDEIVGLISLARNVTKRKEMEATLYESQRSLPALMSKLPSMAYRRRNDERWTMEFVSEGCLDLTGYEPSELLESSVAAYVQLVHPGDREEVLDEVQQAIEQKRPFTLTYRLVTADGEARWVWEQGREVPPIQDGHTHVEGFMADITEWVRAEEELSRKALMLKSLLDVTSDIIVFKDHHCVFLAASQVIAEILGRTQEELIGKTDFDLFPVDQAQVYWDEEQRLMKSGETLVADHELTLPDGGKRSFEVIKKAVLDSDGNVVGLLCSERDITERKRVEERLAEERNLLRTMLDHIPDLIYVMDTECRVAFDNTAHAVALGASHSDEVVGKSAFDLFPEEVARAYHEEDRQALESGQVTQREEVYSDPAGDEKWLLTTRVPLRDPEGNVTGIVGVSHDVTETRRAQEALRQAHDQLEIRVEERRSDLSVADVKLRMEVNERRETEAALQRQCGLVERARSETASILDAIEEATVFVSLEGWILTANRRFTESFGLSQTEVAGNRFEDIQPQMKRIFEDPADLIALVTASTVDPDQQFTQGALQKWPVRRELDVHSTPVKAGDGQRLGRLFVFRDVGREKEVDRMKTEFVSLVSHELRAPLTSIKGYVDLLLSGKVDELDETQLKFLSVVKTNAARLGNLINDLLEVSRIKQGKSELRLATLDLSCMVRDVANSFLPQMETRDQIVTLEVDSDLPYVWADADRVTLILTTLLSNAHIYAPDGGRIAVRAYREDSMVRVDVQDAGMGETPEENSRLFTKFFRPDNLVTRESAGTGLGLVITRSSIGTQGGQILVETEPSVGSTFSFTLPTIPQVEVRDTVSKDAVPGAESEGSRRILVVDDEPEIANLLRSYLERSGYAVLIAHSAAKAFDLAQTERPDLITLDVLLPDANGFTVLEWLKGDEQTRNIPVVFISILPDDGHGELLGAVEYLTKPVTEENLLMHVKRSLGDGH